MERAEGAQSAEARPRPDLLPYLLFATLAIASIALVRNYDLFWHLATGRWIVDHAAIPATDPFALASDREAWINGEWLFEVLAYAIQAAGGLKALSLARALLAAATFTAAYIFARRDSEPNAALLMTIIAWAGATPTLDFRPSSAAMLLVVMAIGLRSAPGHGVLSVIWINVHPSALLAPVIAALTTRRAAPVIASAAGLLVNPFGWRAVAAPFELLAFVSGGTFINAEWLPSFPRLFPLLYLSIAIAIAAFATAREHRKHWWRAVLFAGLAFLAVRHIRHQVLLFAAFPLLVSPLIRLPFRRRIAFAAAAAAIVLVSVVTDRGLGVSTGRFPVHAVARLKESGLRGNIYNPDQFGGYLIWAFYPERRVLTDGRNELYESFIPEYARARGDELRWRGLLEKYAIDLAVDEYRPPIEVVDATTHAKRFIPASLAYWPRREWALVAYDRAAMVFARRAAFSAEQLKQWEIDEKKLKIEH